MASLAGAFGKMDPLGQLYLICTFLGWGFIIATFALGQFGHGHGVHADGAHMGDGHGGHIGGDGGMHGAPGGGHGHSGGHAGGHAQINGHGHSDGAHSHADRPGHAGHIDAYSDALEGTRQTTATKISKSHENQLYFTLLSIFSPVTLSVFTGFFGSAGYIAWHYAPWLSFLTLIPAVVSGVVAVNFVKYMTALVVSKLSASSLTRKEEAIGRIASVNTPIHDGRLGEVSYVIGTNRFNASARSAHPGEEFQRGSKVMIVETQGPVVFVEKASDIDLELMS